MKLITFKPDPDGVGAWSSAPPLDAWSSAPGMFTARPQYGAEKGGYALQPLDLDGVEGDAPLGARGYVPEHWIKKSDAEAQLAELLSKKNFLGQHIYPTQADAVAELEKRLKAKKTGVMEGDTQHPGQAPASVTTPKSAPTYLLAVPAILIGVTIVAIATAPDRSSR